MFSKVLIGAFFVFNFGVSLYGAKSTLRSCEEILNEKMQIIESRRSSLYSAPEDINLKQSDFLVVFLRFKEIQGELKDSLTDERKERLLAERQKIYTVLTYSFNRLAWHFVQRQKERFKEAPPTEEEIFRFTFECLDNALTYYNQKKTSPKIPGYVRFSTYLGAVFKNEIKKEFILKTIQERREKLGLNSLMLFSTSDLGEDRQTLEVHSRVREVLREVDMPDSHKKLIWEIVYGQKNQTQIAAEMGVTQQAIQKKYQKALDRLAQDPRLQELYESLYRK